MDADRLFCMAKKIAKADIAVMSSADAARILEFMCDPDGDMTRDRNHDGDPSSLGLDPDWEADSFRFWPIPVPRAVLRDDEANYDTEFLSILERMIRKWGPLGISAGEIAFDMRGLIGKLSPALRQPEQTGNSNYHDEPTQQDATLQRFLDVAGGELLNEQVLSWRYQRKEMRFLVCPNRLIPQQNCRARWQTPSRVFESFCLTRMAVRHDGVLPLRSFWTKRPLKSI